MTTSLLDRGQTLSLTLILGVGLMVIGVAALLAGQGGAVLACMAVFAGVGLYGISEVASTLLGINRPLERMLFTMLVRGGGGLVAVLTAIAGAGYEPKLVALIALPIYLSLVASEAIGATRLSADPLGQEATRPTEEAR